MTTFDTYYGDVPEHQREALKIFREQYPLQSCHVDGVTWTYHDMGAGEQVILWLVGSIKVADVAYDKFPLLMQNFRIIAPNYPIINTMNGLADGLAGLLQHEKIANVFILAGSFGGMLAQEFVRLYSQMVSKILLSTTTPPSQADAEKYAQQLSMVEPLDDSIVREGAKMQLLSTIAPPESEIAFYQSYLDELFTERLGKSDIVSLYRAIVDYMQRDYQPNDLDNWHGDMLIFDSDNDATFSKISRNSMSVLYPNAQRHTFTGAGHSPGTTQRDEFFRRARQFFLS